MSPSHCPAEGGKAGSSPKCRRENKQEGMQMHPPGQIPSPAPKCPRPEQAHRGSGKVQLPEGRQNSQEVRPHHNRVTCTASHFLSTWERLPSVRSGYPTWAPIGSPNTSSVLYAKPFTTQSRASFPITFSLTSSVLTNYL